MYNLLLKKIEVVRYTRRNGFMVVSPVIQATGGAAETIDLGPLPYKRTRDGWGHKFSGDGVLLKAFEDKPSGVSWSISVTLTNRSEQAKAISDAIRAAVSETGSAVIGSSVSAVTTGVAGVLGNLSDGLDAQVDSLVANTRVIGTVLGSKASDLDRPWTLHGEEGKVRLTLAWRISD